MHNIYPEKLNILIFTEKVDKLKTIFILRYKPIAVELIWYFLI